MGDMSDKAEAVMQAYEKLNPQDRVDMREAIKDLEEGPVMCGVCARGAYEVQHYETCNPCCLLAAEKEGAERELLYRLFLADPGRDAQECLALVGRFVEQIPDQWWEATAEKLERFDAYHEVRPRVKRAPPHVIVP